MRYTFFITGLFLLNSFLGNSQNKNYWQQHVDYKMDINVNAKEFQYDAKQTITYKNNSPDTLKMVFYHLYLNAFQPNSEMDVRLQTIADPDRRMVNNLGDKNNPVYQSRISQLSENQKGYIEIKSLKQNNKSVSYKVVGSMLQVILNQPILPNKKAVFTMEYKAQVPEMIRRTGRNNRDGVALSMTQWYPKLAAYDHLGWRTSQYIAREFHGNWGDFDVKITIDKDYVIGGTGVLQNPKEIGFGYLPQGTKVEEPKGNKRTWHFKAKNVHDFAWAADPEFKHDVVKLANGKTIQFFYKKFDENWKKIQPEMVKVFNFFNQKIGEYPWETYSFIQGGDGGMEYAMCTLVAGGNNYESLLGTSIHELGHAWFQHIFATDELAYPWFDEGLTSYIEDWAKSEVIKGEKNANAWEDSYQCYFRMVKQGLAEVPTTHADRYERNSAYSVTSYCKGSIFASQLGYIIGSENLEKTFKRFYKEYAMTHPEPKDFIRVAEKVSGMQLMWYFNEFMQTTHTIDYAIDKVEAQGNKTKVTLKRVGRMPMPLDIIIIPIGQKPFSCYVPTALTFGEKANPFKNMERIVLPAWGWAYPEYSFIIDIPFSDIKNISIDPQGLSADVVSENNMYLKN